MVCPRTPPYSLFNNESNEHLTAISTKRKASSFDSENADPIQFPPYKKFKSLNGYPDHFSVAIKYPVTSPRRLTLHTCSPAPRLNTTTTPKSISLIVLAGRSPSQKRFGILNRGKTAPLCTLLARVKSEPMLAWDSASMQRCQVQPRAMTNATLCLKSRSCQSARTRASLTSTKIHPRNWNRT